MIPFWFTLCIMTLIALGALMIPVIRYRTNLSLKACISIVVLCALFIACAVSTYLKLGAYKEVSAAQQAALNAKNNAQTIKSFGSLNNVIQTLKRSVDAHPDAQGWFLLGKLYLKAKDFKQASEAFEQANLSAPHRIDILVNAAQSLYLASGEVMTPKAQKWLDETFALDPNQPDALNLQATNAYKTKDYALAIRSWEKLSSELTPGSAEQQAILALIAEAQKK